MARDDGLYAVLGPEGMRAVVRQPKAFVRAAVYNGRCTDAWAVELAVDRKADETALVELRLVDPAGRMDVLFRTTLPAPVHGSAAVSTASGSDSAAPGQPGGISRRNDMGWWVYLEDRNTKPYCSYGLSELEYAAERAFGRHQLDLDDGPCPSPCYPPVVVERHAEGGTYALGGTTSAEVSVTYNYADLFREALGGGFAEVLTGRRAADVLPLLEAAVAKLGTEQDRDYWCPTPGNAGRVLALLASWARQHPDAVFRVS